MASRHLPRKRIMSGVLFSAPGAMPVDGWGDDIPITRTRGFFKSPLRPTINTVNAAVAGPMLRSYNPTDTIESDNIEGTYKREHLPFHQYNVIPNKASPTAEPRVTLCLPLLKATVEATVDDTIAHTQLIQRFQNPSDHEISEARHIFPLYDGAVITSFECTIGDERRIRGVVKSKDEARKQYQTAVKEKMEVAVLLEELTPEIFETSLGHIPPETTVEIKLTYVNELKIVLMDNVAADGIAITIPTSIAPRYSKSPLKWNLEPTVEEDKIDIWLRVVNNGKVDPDGCRVESEHNIIFEGAKAIEYSNAADMFDLQDGKKLDQQEPDTCFIWHHESPQQSLRKDFVFVIKMREGHQLRSRAVISPEDSNGLAAVMVNIRPNDLFGNAVRPESFSGELLFLLDQSGSMGGGRFGYSRRSRDSPSKIDTMRDAMSLVIAGIPTKCSFNIISWGTATYGLWDSSRQRSEQNMAEAKKYLSQIDANLGGTDLLRALESVVKRRIEGSEQTQIIIITDGEFESDEVIKFVWQTRQKIQDRIRFFTLGIGDAVSHRHLEGIAELGGGYCDVVDIVERPRWEDRLNRMLRSALEPNSWTCDLSLGDSYERKSLESFRLGIDNLPERSASPYVQMPHPVPPLHPFTYKSIFFLVDVRHGKPPHEVVLTTSTVGAKIKSYTLCVDSCSAYPGSIHQLATKAALLALERDLKIHQSQGHFARENGKRLGQMYSITSEWTSFVAVTVKDVRPSENHEIEQYKALAKDIDIDEQLGDSDVEGNIGDYEIKKQGGSLPYNHAQLTGGSALLQMSLPGFSETQSFGRKLRSILPRRKLAPSRSGGDVHIAQAIKNGHLLINSPVEDDDGYSSTVSGMYPPRSPSPPKMRVGGVSPLEFNNLHQSGSKQSENPDTDKEKSRLKERFVPRNENLNETNSSNQSSSKSTRDRRVSDASYTSGLRSFGQLRPRAPVVSPPLRSERRHDDYAGRLSASSPPIPPLKEPVYSSTPRSTVDQASVTYEYFEESLSPHNHIYEDGNYQAHPLPPRRDSQLGQHSAKGPRAIRQSNRSKSSSPARDVRDGREPYLPEPNQGTHPVKPMFSDANSDAGSQSWETSSASLSIIEAESCQLSVDGPILWQDAVACQNGQGLFEVLDPICIRLHSHFCPSSASKLSEHIRLLRGFASGSTQDQQSKDIGVIVDTLMMMQYFRTHLAAEEDVWALMVARAEVAVLTALGLPDDNEEALNPVLKGLDASMMHEHYNAIKGRDGKERKEPENSCNWTRCAACGVHFGSATRFFCPFDQEYFEVWEEFWHHQVRKGHMVCPEIIVAEKEGQKADAGGTYEAPSNGEV